MAFLYHWKIASLVTEHVYHNFNPYCTNNIAYFELPISTLPAHGRVVSLSYLFVPLGGMFHMHSEFRNTQSVLTTVDIKMILGHFICTVGVIINLLLLSQSMFISAFAFWTNIFIWAPYLKNVIPVIFFVLVLD